MTAGATQSNSIFPVFQRLINFGRPILVHRFDLAVTSDAALGDWSWSRLATQVVSRLLGKRRVFRSATSGLVHLGQRR